MRTPIKDALVYLLITFFLLSTMLSRVLWFPFNVSIVSGYSMYPAITPGDVVISVHKDLIGFNVGDVVVWCGTWTHCVIHRVSEVGTDYVVTKGDNNPLSDPPLTLALVKYRVVLRIPVVLWGPLLTSLLVTYLYVKRESLVRLLYGLRDVEVFTYLVFLFINLLIISLVPVNYLSVSPVLVTPSITLEKVMLSSNGAEAVIKYNLRDLSLLYTENCIITVENTAFYCGARVSNDSVIVEIPRKVYTIAISKPLTYVRFSLRVSLDKGFLDGEYSVLLSWSRLVVESSDSSLLIYNPNYGPVNVSYVRVQYVGLDEVFGTPKSLGVKVLEPFTVDGGDFYRLLIEGRGTYAYVTIRYYVGGAVVEEQRKVEFR